MTSRLQPLRDFLAGLLGPLLAAVFLASGAGPAVAAATAWLDHEQVELRLLSAGGAAGDDLRLGLHFRIQPGWKIYWRTPGEAGFPPTADWTGSENLAEAEILWPVPHRFTLFGLDTFGYADEVVLPIRARAAEPGAPVALNAAVSYLTCSEICVPHDGVLRLEVPGGSTPASPEATLIAQAEILVPGDGSAVGLSFERAVLLDGDPDPVLEVVARSQTPFEAPDVLVEGPPGFTFAAPDVKLRDGGRQAVMRLQSGRGFLAEGVLEGKRIVLTVTDGQRGMEAESITRFAPGRAPGPAFDGLALIEMIGLAVLGGLILNLMPCVLPVLSIKLLSVVKHGGRERREVRIGFLASAAGILFSFLVLAGVAIALKSAGLAAGWGIQFQQPLFLTAMALLLTLFAANLFGFFEVPLPAAIADFAGSGQGHGLAGHFATGAFATLLATPCTAPFLGTAVGFALARGAAEILVIFAALGVGLALPYLSVAALPGLATRLPRPGPWMVTLRRILGLALAGTVVWLMTVLARQVGTEAAWLAGALLIALGLSLWLGRRLPRPALPVLAGALAVAVLAAPAGFAAGEREVPPPVAEGDWQPFDEGRIASIVAEGGLVFVDVTADWCLTCQVNKALVIDTERVAGDFAEHGVVLMRGDWTLPSEVISDYLADHGRYGIAFNVVYGPAAPEGELLPELLTVNAVLDAVHKAAGS
jgi:suppressor for copper-sensitivity B